MQKSPYAFGSKFEKTKLSEFLKQNIQQKLDDSTLKKDKAVKLVIDGSSAKILNIYYSQSGIPCYAENVVGFKNFAERILKCLKNAVESFNLNLSYKAVAFFEGAVEWEESQRKEAIEEKKVSTFENSPYRLALEEKLKKPPKSLKREMCIRGFQQAGVETLHADTEVEMKLVLETHENCIGILSGEVEYLFFEIESVIPFLSISFEEDDEEVSCVPVYLPTIRQDLKIDQEHFRAIGSVLAFSSVPPHYKFIWGSEKPDAAVQFVTKHMKADETCIQFLNRISELSLDETETKYFGSVGANVKTFANGSSEKIDIFNHKNFIHPAQLNERVFEKLVGYTPEVGKLFASQENSFLDQFHKAKISNRCVELLFNRHFWWPTILQDESLPQPFAETLPIRKRLYKFLFGSNITLHEEIRIFESDLGHVQFKNETCDKSFDFNGQNMFTVWSLSDWRDRIKVLAQILLGEEANSDITQKLIQEKNLTAESIVFALMFKSITLHYSFVNWDQESCIRVMLNHSAFSLNHKTQDHYKNFLNNLSSYIKVPTNSSTPIINRASDRRHISFSTLTEDEKKLMIFGFSRLEAMVYHVLFVSSFLNLPDLFLSSDKDSGIPLVGLNARINIQYKPKSSSSSSSSSSSYSSTSSSHSSSSHQKHSSSGSQRGASASSKSGSGPHSNNKPRPQSSKPKEPEEDDDGFTKVSHKPKAAKPQQNSWWSGQQQQGGQSSKRK